MIRQRFSCRKVLYTMAMLVLLAVPAGRLAAADAAHLTVLFVIDTRAGEIDGDNRHRDVALGCMQAMQGLIDDVNSQFPGRIFLNVLQGNDVTPQNIRNFYKRNVGYDPRGHLLFYYYGHGATDKKSGHFLATSGGNILRREIYNLMADTGAPGIFMLTHCCSDYAQFAASVTSPQREQGTPSTNFANPRNPLLALRARETPPSAFRGNDAPPAQALNSQKLALPLGIVNAAQMQQTARRRANVQLFYDLFYRCQGVYNISAAGEGSSSWGNVFTMSLAEHLSASSSVFHADGQAGPVTWEQFYFKVRNRTNARFHEIRDGSGENDHIRKEWRAQIPQAFSLGTWPKNFRRQLLVKNDSGRKIRVFVKYHELDFHSDAWSWRQPKGSYTLETGAATTLIDGNAIVGGNKVRIWAESEDGQVQWHEYRDKDLMLTPAAGVQGPITRFTFTFNAP